MSVPAAPLSLRALLRVFAAVMLLLASHLVEASTIRVPQDAPTIQSALNTSIAGDTVLVAPGTYKENLKIAKEVRLLSTDGPAKTIIDGSAGHTQVISASFLSSFTTEISGFTIRGGGDPNITPTSAIDLEASAITFTNDVFVDNIDRHINAFASTLIVRDSKFYASVPSGQYCRPPDGIRLFGSLSNYNGNTTPSLIEHSTFVGDSTVCTGSGVAGDAADILIRNNLFQGTRYAVAMNPTKITFTQNIVTGSYGGALSISHAYGVYPQTDPADFEIRNNTFVDNMHAGLDLYTNHSVFYLSLLVGKFLLANNIVKESSVTGAVVNCDSIIPPLKANELSVESYTPAILDHNVLYAPAIPLVTGRGCSDPTGSDGNISVDPKLDQNFRPLSGSPAIDAGNSSINLETLDYAGNPRVLDGLGRGYPTVDMGAFEIAGPSSTPVNPLILKASSYFMQPGIVTLTAQLKDPLLAGSIRFFQDSSSIALLTSDAAGSASTQINLLPGLYKFTAAYAPLAAAAPGVSAPIYIYVTKYQTYLQISTIPSGSALVNQVVTVHLKLGSILGGVPPGPVTVSEGSTVLGTVTPDPATGIADLPIGTLALGSHKLTAQYAGNNLYDSGTNSTTINIVPLYVPTCTITDSPTSSVIGSPVVLTMLVSRGVGSASPASPTGRVDFYDGASIIGSSPLASGVAQITTSGLTVGIHALSAKFVADFPYADVTASVNHQVTLSPSSTALSVSPNPAQAQTPVALVAHVSTTNGSAPTGNVSFREGSAVLASGVLDSTGTVNVSINSLAVGSHLLTAYYGGDANNQPSNSAASTLRIDGLATQISVSAPQTAYAFQGVSLGAQVKAVSGINLSSGAVTFRSGGKLLGVSPLDSAGNAAISIGFPAGTYNLSAEYSASGPFVASGPVSTSISVVPDSTGIALSASPSVQIQRRSVIFSATAVANHSATPPSGSVSIFDGSVSVASGSVDATGHVTLSVSTLSVGKHTVTAAYTPASGDFLASLSNSVVVTISPSDFALSTPPSFTVPAEHHADITANLESIGDLAGAVHLHCANLPPHATCYFLHGDTAQLTAGGTASVNVWFETSDVRGYKSELRHNGGGVVLALLIGPGLLLVKKRRGLAVRLCLFLGVGLSAATALMGCSGLYPAYTPPGSYTFQIVADHPVVSHSNSVTVTVTR